MKKIKNYQIVDLGIDSPDYFQGFGTSFTNYKYSAVGMGSNVNEAIEDLLDQVAEQDFDVDSIKIPKHKNISVDDMDEMYYYIGIRWN